MRRAFVMLGLLVVALTCGCATANWKGFDAHTTPPEDLKWMSRGAAFDGLMHVAKVPVVWRAVADVTMATTVRVTRCCGKNLDSGVGFMFGAGLWEIGAFFRKAIRGQR